MMIKKQLSTISTMCVLTLALIFASYNSNAQDCQSDGAASGVYLDGNNVRAFIDPSGSLFWDGQFSQFEAGDFGQEVNTIFAQGLWLSGLNSDGEIQLSAASYGKSSDNFDYYPGALESAGDNQGTISSEACVFWNKTWSVSRDDILSHRADFEDNGVIDNPITTVFDWPGRANSNLSWPDAVYNQGFAPFFDLNGDGVYTPQSGDYPNIPQSDLIPSEITWCVFNTKGGPANDSGSNATPTAEIHLLTWAFECTDDIVLNNTLFLSYKIANRNTEELLDTKIGFWHDFDLGCYTDDFIGSAPNQNTFFVYNQSNSDALCPIIGSAGDNPPAQAVTILNRDLSHFIHMSNGSVGTESPGVTDPNTTIEYFNYLNGLFRDGTPITEGGNGYNPSSGNEPVNFSFPGDPNQLEEWSELSANSAPSDRRALGSVGLADGEFAAGAIVQIDLAYSYHREPGFSNLQNVAAMYDNVDAIQAVYDTEFADICGFTATEQEPVWAKNIQLFPNPVSDQLTINYGDTAIDQLQLWDNFGRLLYSFDQPKQIVNVSHLPAGIYYLRMSSKGEAVIRKVSKM